MSAGRGIFQIHPPTNVRIVLCNASKKMQSSKMFFGVDGLGDFVVQKAEKGCVNV